MNVFVSYSAMSYRHRQAMPELQGYWNIGWSLYIAVIF